MAPQSSPNSPAFFWSPVKLYKVQLAVFLFDLISFVLPHVRLTHEAYPVVLVLLFFLRDNAQRSCYLSGSVYQFYPHDMFDSPCIWMVENESNAGLSAFHRHWMCPQSVCRRLSLFLPRYDFSLPTDSKLRGLPFCKRQIAAQDKKKPTHLSKASLLQSFKCSPVQARSQMI